jgi:hypothetical protein
MMMTDDSFFLNIQYRQYQYTKLTSGEIPLISKNVSIVVYVPVNLTTTYDLLPPRRILLPAKMSRGGTIGGEGLGF